jgi:FKBP12-rapamycin complex-associated protein
VYAPIATELYNIAFVSCWKIMSDKGKEKIMDNYLNAIRSPSKPTVVLQTILNLAEFMELDESTDIKLFAASTLAKIAEQCNAYAKALYYWELEFENDPKNTIELLIQTNYGLQQPEAAEGILEYAKKNILIDEKEDWYEKLHRWRDALRIYEHKEITEPMNFDILKGKLNCFRNLSDWDNLSHAVEQMWDQHQQNDQEQDQIQRN